MSRSPWRSPQRDTLEAAAARNGWTRGDFGSYKAFGFTIGVGSQTPRQFVAIRGETNKAFKTIGELERYVAYVGVTGREPEPEGAEA